MASVRVTAEPFDPALELAAPGLSDDAGGVACFIGRVRGGGGLRALRLEHYPGMTERALQRIAEEAERRWSLLEARIVHRVGDLAVGEPIVFVRATSTHRAASLAATGFMIDWLKTDAPFWKCELFEDGREEWVHSAPPIRMHATPGSRKTPPTGVP